jgi:hypothetical protein
MRVRLCKKETDLDNETHGVLGIFDDVDSLFVCRFLQIDVVHLRRTHSRRHGDERLTLITRSPIFICPHRPAGEFGSTDLIKMPDTVLPVPGSPPLCDTSTRPPTMLMPASPAIISPTHGSMFIHTERSVWLANQLHCPCFSPKF